MHPNPFEKYKQYDNWYDFITELRKPNKKVRLLTVIFVLPQGAEKSGFTRVEIGSESNEIKGLPYNPIAVFEAGEVHINTGNFKGFEVL